MQAIREEISLVSLISATGIGVFMSVIDSSVVNISLFQIASFFRVNLGSAQWIILAYLLTLSALMLIAGDFGDRFGNKQVFQIGLLIFTLTSFLNGISVSLEMLIVFRVVQAIGASFIMSNGVAIITKLTDKGKRGQAIGWNSLIVSSGLIVGPTIGGLLTEFFGWASIFFINVPIGIIGYFLVKKQIPQIPRNSNLKKIDFLGASLFGLFIITFVSAVTFLKDTSSQNIIFFIALFSLSFIFGISFFIWSHRSSSPILNLDLLRNRTFSFSILASITTFVLIQVVLFQLPYFLQGALSLTPFKVSLTIFGVPIMMALTGPWAGRLSDRVEPKIISTLGVIGIGLVLILLAIMTSVSMDIILLALLMFFFGLVIGVFAAPNSNAIMSSVPKVNAGIAGAMLALARNLGFSIGIGLSTTILLLFETVYSSQRGGELMDPMIYSSAFQSMVFVAGLLVIVPALISYYRGSNYYEDEKETNN